MSDARPSPIVAADLFAAGRITLDACVDSQMVPSPSIAVWSCATAVFMGASAAAFAIAARDLSLAVVTTAPLAGLALREGVVAVREWRAYVARRRAHIAAVAAVEAARRNLNAPETAR